MTSSNSKRIAKNTLMLYFRQILILLVSLYTVRVVLNALGVEDYGVYSVVGGIVSLFSFLSATMSSATQRFFSFSLGQNDLTKLKQVFSVNLLIYFGIALVAFILLETIGLWFVKEHLKVPADRFDAALIVFHFSVLTFIATIIKAPFVAMIIAHEDMQIYAYVSIIEAIMKLGVAALIVFLPWDKLEVYGVLLFAVSLVNAALYSAVGFYKYSECQIKKFYWDKIVFYEIIGFTGWTLFGQLTTVFRNQAITILVNQYFTPVVVTARAIAVNITGQINVFSNGFNTSLYPPIIKAYSMNEKKKMFSLIFNGSKITFFLMWIFTLPFFLEMETILIFWLKNPPPAAILFTRLALVEVLILSISLPIASAARAPGRMKVYELTLGSIQIGIFLAAWLILSFGADAYSVFIVAIVANLIMFIIRLLIVSKLIQLPVHQFLKNVALPITMVMAISAIPSFGIHYSIPDGILYSAVTVVTSIVFSSFAMYYIGLDKAWRLKVNTLFLNKMKQIF